MYKQLKVSGTPSLHYLSSHTLTLWPLFVKNPFMFSHLSRINIFPLWHELTVDESLHR